MSFRTCPTRHLTTILAALLACAPAPPALVDEALPAPAPPALVDEALPAPARRFLVGNETAHDLFARELAGRRGALLGVGGDACYTLMALADSERAYLLDHDPQVVALHRALGPRIAATPDPEQFLAALTTPPNPELAASWPAITAHLRRVAARPHTWLSDPGLYARVHRLWQTGAVSPVLGDLGGALAMPTIAAHAAHAGLTFTVVYLSNVEESLPDRRRLDENLAALPRDPDALVLRTLHRPDWPAADLWSYQSHALTALLARDRDRLGDLAAILADAATRGALTFTPQAPAHSTIAR
ncbi:hypothetical protein [Nannocystis sp.]|uniref:LIC_10091 family protein n=1 Tax=Nannocystis sp. TaxID=1962667 RepID=UPI0025FD3E16|nr:hypothetical protein [Nannocystis sp.]MBK7826435.1 hypothetical protein [Nannocystis sp.]